MRFSSFRFFRNLNPDLLSEAIFFQFLCCKRCHFLGGYNHTSRLTPRRLSRPRGARVDEAAGVDEAANVDEAAGVDEVAGLDEGAGVVWPRQLLRVN